MKKLYVSIADTDEKRASGLMHKKHLDPNKGMLFKFPYSHHLRFWMKNTYIPLDIAFIDDNFKVIQIERMYPLSTRAITAQHPCKYALEVNSGWFDKNGIKVGTQVSGALRKEMKLLSQIKKDEGYRKDEKKDIDIDLKVDKPKKEIKEDSIFDKNFGEDPPEMDVEGEYPQSAYTEPIENLEQEEGSPKPEIEHIRDTRGKIKFAEENGLEMEILYWTLRGHMLPPRRIRPLPDEGYVMKSGKSGEYLVAFDASPTIQGQGWSIKGLQPKSFILDNIVQLQIFDKQGNQMTDQQVASMKAGNQLPTNQPNQQNQPAPKEQPNKKPTFFEGIKNFFGKK